MNAPVLTPGEQAEVSRFGIHDEDVIAWLEDHQDETPGCERPAGCEKPAVARFIVHCACRRSRLGCEGHTADTAKWFDAKGDVTCRTCSGRVVGYTVVPL